MRVVGMCGGIVVLRTWRPPVAQAEVGPLSNAAREKRADPSLTWLERARKHVKSRTDSGFTNSHGGVRGGRCLVCLGRVAGSRVQKGLVRLGAEALRSVLAEGA